MLSTRWSNKSKQDISVGVKVIFCIEQVTIFTFSSWQIFKNDWLCVVYHVGIKDYLEILFLMLDHIWFFCWHFRHASEHKYKKVTFVCVTKAVWLIKCSEHSFKPSTWAKGKKNSLCVVVGKTKKGLFNFKMHVQIILQKLCY